MEGFPRAAANFSKEANLQPQQENSSIRDRQGIQNYIHSGEIQSAIDALNKLDVEVSTHGRFPFHTRNDLKHHAPRIGLRAADERTTLKIMSDPMRCSNTLRTLYMSKPLTIWQILDGNPPLHFALLRLQLVELIRHSNGSPSGAVTFAREKLGPRAPQNEQFLQDLEQTMSLLFFSPEKLPDELKYLLEPGLRRDVADKVNMAILHHQSRRREAAIRQLVKMRAWAENTARESKKELPDRIDLGIHGDGGDSFEERGHENGHEPMITT